VWDVLAITEESGGGVWRELQSADLSDGGAERMRATLETDVPLNGPPLMNKTKCRDLGDEIFEFKEGGWRVLWFYDTGEPVKRRRIICSHASRKIHKKEFQKEITRAVRLRQEYMAAKWARRLIEPKNPEDHP
jgi:hypothetical protein